MAKNKGRARKRIGAYQKEAGLLFLAIFYFIIATNTQTGWLFVLSAFLFGVLGVSWTLSRRAHHHLEIEQAFLGEPQKGRVFRVTTRLVNTGPRTVQEAKLVFQHPDWAEPQEEPFHWAVPQLQGHSAASVEQKLVPLHRGEHSLPPVELVCGAPFGLFTMKRRSQSDQQFLVYPNVERLPSLNNRSRLATSFAELVSARNLGDTRNLRSVREYRSGDDLRQVHWKASAKLGGTNLLVKEHHAPAPSRTVLVLDTSSAADDGFCALFERAVTLTTSLLWAAQREGTRTCLFLLSAEGEWSTFSQWAHQYRALAKVRRDPKLSFADWRESAELFFQKTRPADIRGSQVALIKSLSTSDSVELWPTWMKTGYLIWHSKEAPPFPSDPRLHVIDASEQGFQEAFRV